MNNEDYKYMAPGSKENMEQRAAFEHWVNQGRGRTLVATRKEFSMSSATVKKWHSFFKWQERLEEREGTGVDLTLYRPKDTPVESQEMLDLKELIGRLKKMVETAFEVDPETGEERPRFDIVSLSGFTKIVKEYRDTVEAYARLMSNRDNKKQKAPERSKIADTVNFIMGEMSQEERLELIKSGANKNILIPRGDGTSQPASEDADYEEVSDGGVQDGWGCEGVPGGVAGAKSGDESELPKRSGGKTPHIAFPRIE